MSQAPFLVLERLTKRFGGVAAVDGISLQVARGDLLALLGPSGSGKTTTLRLLAGFETPDGGRIAVDGEEVTSTPPAGRRFGMVFQHYALFPHLDVGANVAFGLESQDVPAADRLRRVAEALALVELPGLERRRVNALSGGQQQRVALARALAPEPRVLLLDEPLSNLDPGLRERTRRELRALIGRIGITTILVTHEQEEAFDLADHVALLQRGRLEQVGTPEALYNAPATAFVAGFIGRTSAVPVRVIAHEQRVARVRIADSTIEWEVPGEAPLTGAQRLFVRPEALRIVPASETVLTGLVTERRFLGATTLFTVRLGCGSTLEVQGGPGSARSGDRVGLVPDGAGAGLHLLPWEAGPG
ncbi:MAG TPA: ABC transporter ATP-binding protein [Gemmatimonadales bacterium]|jgi:ABC-type Fe3+/spermidine/putrescine transport system ATPase subunit|nr:ABC transporter ATP-binding protein [Gemmatimonadales bacterium]